MAQEAPTGGEQAAMRPDAPTKDERLDFLRQAIAFTEWTIRSFDTKAQISIAAFVLSMNPLWTILSAACPRAASSLIVAVLLMLFVATVLLFGFVIWPVTLTQSKLTGGWQTKGLFYVGDPNQLTASLYTDRLKDLDDRGRIGRRNAQAGLYSRDQEPPVQARPEIGVRILRVGRGGLPAIEELRSGWLGPPKASRTLETAPACSPAPTR